MFLVLSGAFPTLRGEGEGRHSLAIDAITGHIILYSNDDCGSVRDSRRRLHLYSVLMQQLSAKYVESTFLLLLVRVREGKGLH